MFCNFCHKEKDETSNDLKKCRNCRRKCEHGKRKNVCKDCGGVSLCKHKREKHTCKDCGGKSICKHGRRKSVCKDCGGVSICEHDNRKVYCKECNGSSVCIHNKIKQSCREGCGGQRYCIHGIHKQYCLEGCGGSSRCEHNSYKSRCIICNPLGNFIARQRGYIKRRLSTKKTYNTKTYIGCSNEVLFNHIKSQMTPDMTFDNIHIDHIKPISRFDLTNDEEIKKCFHYTNLQPMLIHDNLTKSNKWSNEEETNWQNNIIKI